MVSAASSAAAVAFVLGALVWYDVAVEALKLFAVASGFEGLASKVDDTIVVTIAFPSSGEILGIIEIVEVVPFDATPFMDIIEDVADGCDRGGPTRAIADVGFIVAGG